MHIQWFPGHMTKALRMMKENVKLVDCFLYVLDARAVFSCINPTFDEIIGTKPVLYIINKADLINKRYYASIGARLEREGKRYIFANSKTGANVKEVVAVLREMNAAKINRYRDKGVTISVRAMVIGIPNSGKSTLINSLCGGKRTVTGDRPGVTKGKQWVILDKGLELLDTPGTLCPSFRDAVTGEHLAYLGSINDAIIDTQELCFSLLDYMLREYPQNLSKRYGDIDLTVPKDDIMKQIARIRGFVERGGEYDVERAYAVLIDDFRKGKLGDIALEVE